jgi:hypothetical protein
MVEGEVGQSYTGGTITVGTQELTPWLLNAVLGGGGSPAYKLYAKDAGGFNYSIVVDLSQTLPTDLFIVAQNAGDEELDFKFYATIDGVIVLDEIMLNVAVEGGLAGSTKTLPVSALTTGRHKCAWTISVRASGTTNDFVTFSTAIVPYLCYTAPMDARASSVMLIQNDVEIPWLTGTPTGFSETPARVLPNVPVTVRYNLTNPGDEPVLINIAHLEGATKKTGVIIGGVLLDTNLKDVNMEPGATATIDLQPFTATAGSTSIGAFSVYRAKMLRAREPPCNNLGDLDDDGFVTTNDEALMKDFSVGGWAVIAGRTPLTEAEFTLRAHLHAGGTPGDAGDVAAIKDFIIGKINTFPLCGT